MNQLSAGAVRCEIPGRQVMPAHGNLTIHRKNATEEPCFQVLREPVLQLRAPLTLGKLLYSLLNFRQRDDAHVLCWSVVSSQRLTPRSGPPVRLYSDRTFVSIRNPLIQDQ